MILELNIFIRKYFIAWGWKKGNKMKEKDFGTLMIIVSRCIVLTHDFNFVHALMGFKIGYSLRHKI